MLARGVAKHARHPSYPPCGAGMSAGDHPRGVATQAVSVRFGEASVDVSIQLEGGELYQLALHLYQVRVRVRVGVRARVKG